MSEENVEIVRRIYDEIPAGLDAIRDLYGPDYEIDLTAIAPDVGVVRGLDAADEAMRPYYEMFEGFHVEIDELIHADDEHVVTAIHDGGRLRGSDAEVRNYHFHLFGFRHGKVIRFSAYLDRDSVLKAAGLSE
jgi:ketosteroid isomerase-like protein